MAPRSFAPFRPMLDRARPIDPFALRVTVSGGSENPRGEFVLYWAQSARRMRDNLAVDYAISRANEAGLPVVVYESLRPDYPGANDRIHSFVLEGVVANRRDAEARGLRYHFFLPRTVAEARGVVVNLARRARLVVTDEFPTFVVRAQTARFVSKSPVPVHVVDHNGIVPMRAFTKEQYSAKFLRDRAHRMFPDFWMRPGDLVEPRHQFEGSIEIDGYDGRSPREAARTCEIDHAIQPVRDAVGGRDEALRTLDRFVGRGLRGYAEQRNRSLAHTSGLSPYLHFGFVSIREVAERVLFSGAPDDDIDDLLEEAIIRRELSFNLCFHRADHDSLSALPDWAKKTLDAHRRDRRQPHYSAADLETASTDDEVWNLAQRQLLACGTMHGYLRMVWGKRIIEWSETPEEAHAVMLALHERYALDGRDPNTHAGVLWCFGKHDRPWAPERPIFGTIRYMSSEATRRKVRLGEIELAVRGCSESRQF